MDVSVSESSSLQEKYSLKRLDFALKKVETTISLHLELLRQQKNNIKKYRASESWNDLEKEQTNASRMVQALKADISEIEILAQQNLQEQDLPLFAQKIAPIQQQIHCEIQAFLEVRGEEHLPQTRKTQAVDLSPASSLLFGVEQDLGEDSVTEAHHNQQVLEESVSTSHALLESWEGLKEELEDLNGALHSFAQLVHSQGEKVERIDQMVTDAKDNVQEGKGFLKKAAILKAAILPVAGATLGCAIFGPVGLVVGLKVAGVCAIGGGILGYSGGKYYEKRRTRAVEEVEMSSVSSTDGNPSAVAL